MKSSTIAIIVIVVLILIVCVIFSLMIWMIRDTMFNQHKKRFQHVYNKPKEIDNCPRCNNEKVVLNEVAMIHGSAKSNYRYLKWLYKCNSCELEFTTTESDKMTMINIKNAKK